MTAQLKPLQVCTVTVTEVPLLLFLYMQVLSSAAGTVQLMQPEPHDSFSGHAFEDQVGSCPGQQQQQQHHHHTACTVTAGAAPLSVG
jgi:hypothetical protein